MKLNATQLICFLQNLCETLHGLCFTTLTALNNFQKHKLEVMENLCLCYVNGTVDSRCNSINKLRSCCNILSVEQCILALERFFCKVAPDFLPLLHNFHTNDLYWIFTTQIFLSFVNLWYKPLHHFTENIENILTKSNSNLLIDSY